MQPPPPWSSFNPKVLASRPSLERRRLMRGHAHNYLHLLQELETMAISRTRPDDVREAREAVQVLVSNPGTDDKCDDDDSHKEEKGPGDGRGDDDGIDKDRVDRELTAEARSPLTDTDIAAASAPSSSPATALDSPVKTAPRVYEEPDLRSDPRYTISKDQLIKLLLHRQKIKMLWSKMNNTIQEEKNRNSAGEKYAKLFEREKHMRMLQRLAHHRLYMGDVCPQKKRLARSPLREEWHLDEWLWEQALDDAKRKEEHWHKKDDEGRRVHKI